jgi:hypothetical protein
MISSAAVKMRVRPGTFNLFLGLMVWVGLAAGCASGSKEKAPEGDQKADKQASTLRLHMETESSGMDTGKIKIKRTPPSVTLNVEKNAFADEGYLEEARVLDGMAGPILYLKFNTQGALRLQMWTVARPGRRVAVWSKWTEGRWLGAPQINKPIEDGLLVFSPDATREELERIARGLNNVAIKLGNQKKPDKAAEEVAKKKEKEKAKSAAKVARETDQTGRAEEEMFLK